MNAASYVISAAPQPTLPVVGETGTYPVRRIWCVGRNYLEHIREMGNDERAPPFFFAKHADMLVPDGATIPYPPLTKDLHHEVELIVAMKSGGLNIPADKALDHVYGYAVGIDLTRRDLQIASRKKERPWEVGKSFDYSAPCSAIQPASKIGHPAKGKIWLTVNGKETQKGDLTELIWNVPEIIWQLSQQVKLAAGDIIMTGTPAGVSQLKPGDKIECGVDGVGTLKVRSASRNRRASKAIAKCKAPDLVRGFFVAESAGSGGAKRSHSRHAIIAGCGFATAQPITS